MEFMPQKGSNTGYLSKLKFSLMLIILRQLHLIKGQPMRRLGLVFVLSAVMYDVCGKILPLYLC